MKDLGVLLNLREPSLLPSTVSLAELVDDQVVNQSEVVLLLLASTVFVVAMRVDQVVTQREVMLVAMPEYGVFVFKE